mgnify:CR=1 FL=1
MIRYETKPVVFNLDDFCEEIMTAESWKILLELKRRYHKLKITMFTIPFLCTEEWLRMVKKTYPWIEMHYHGSNHSDRDEWLARTEWDAPYSSYFFRGFKAPWWRLGQPSADMLDKKGFVISACRGYFDVNASRVYHFNIGNKHIHKVWYEREAFHSVHSHVQHQKTYDGLPDGDLLDQLLSAFPKNSRFLFISELFNPKSQLQL